MTNNINIDYSTIRDKEEQKELIIKSYLKIQSEIAHLTTLKQALKESIPISLKKELLNNKLSFISTSENLKKVPLEFLQLNKTKISDLAKSLAGLSLLKKYGIKIVAKYTDT